MEPNQAAVEKLIAQKTGIDPQVIGCRKIERAIRNRLQSINLVDERIYLQLLQTSPAEFQAFIEEIVVPETWFFRDCAPFEFLLKYIQAEGVTAPRSTPWRLLSVPCSTGEEPYSMAMTLLAAGLSPEQFTIDAVDISKNVIEQAQQATYGKNSFRGRSFLEKDSYFQSTSKGDQVCGTVRQCVNFFQGNLLTVFSGKILQYDIIFCRNLLIYLNPGACEQVVKIMERLLVSQGLLFVGAAETAKIRHPHLVSIRQPMTFAYQKSIGVPTKNPASPLSSERVPGRLSSVRRMTSEAKSKKSVNFSPVIASASESKMSPDLSLEMARQLADGGNLEAAISQCHQYLKYHRASAEAYTLLGILHQAKTENAQAEIYLERALYLNPDAGEALIHLALLKEYRGDQKGAKLLYERLKKLEK